MEQKQQTIGDYVMGKTLGSGSYGKVKIGYSKITGKQVAIKIISKSQFLTKPDAKSKIRREIAVMRLLEHPHLLKFEEVVSSPHHIYIVIEYAQHGELFDYITTHSEDSYEQALRFYREMIYGLDYLHTHAICHRDLKPENILLDEFDHVKIADFGFARWMKANIAETSCGSPHYAAPEIIRGEKYDGRAADIWSSGVVLYALLARKLPFNDNAIRRVLEKVLKGTYVMPDLPGVLQDLISRILVVDINKRITLDQIKDHPAFRMFLPECYVIPRPLPIPVLSEPMETGSIDPSIINILQSIGYPSEEEVISELTADHHTNAKVFYQMFAKDIKYETLPWGDESDLEHSIPDESAFMMSPRPVGVTMNNIDSFGRMKKIPDISSPPPAQSLVHVPKWADSFKYQNKEQNEIEQLIEGIPFGIEDMATRLQEYFNTIDVKWFYPDDMNMILKKDNGKLYMCIEIIVESTETIALKVILKQGMEFEFDVFLDDFSSFIQSIVPLDPVEPM